jgi:hypothetical protein
MELVTKPLRKVHCFLQRRFKYSPQPVFFLGIMGETTFNTHTNNELNVYEIWGFHLGSYEDDNFLESNAV